MSPTAQMPGTLLAKRSSTTHRPLLELDAGALEVAGGGLHADADDRELGLDLAPRLGDGARELAAAAAELRHHVAEDHLDAALAVEPLERARQRRVPASEA